MTGDVWEARALPGGPSLELRGGEKPASCLSRAATG